MAPLGCLLHKSPKSNNNVFIFVGLTTLGTVNWILIGWLIKLSVKTLQPLIVIYRSNHFVYNHWGCTSINRPLSYPFRFLQEYHVIKGKGLWMCVQPPYVTSHTPLSLKDLAVGFYNIKNMTNMAVYVLLLNSLIQNTSYKCNLTLKTHLK